MRVKAVVLLTVLATGIAAVAAWAAGADADVTDSPDSAPVPEPPRPPREANPLADFTTNPMYDDGVTPEMVEESKRLAAAWAPAEPLPPEAVAKLPPLPEKRLEWARSAEVAEHERFRARAAAGFPEERNPVTPPDGATCRRLCEFLIECSREADPSAARHCVEACRRADMGDRWRADRILELRSCDHI